MNKLRSAIFSVVCIAILGCVLICKVLERTPLSDVMKDVCKESSQLEGRDYEHLPELSYEAIVTATFQSDFEQYVADSIPWRDRALLMNAGLQRSQIALANLAFGYSCYPTFFGSGYVYAPEHDAVVETLVSYSPNHRQAMDRAASALNALAGENQGVSFYLLALDRASASDANPTLNYISDPLTYSTFDERLFEQLDPSISVAEYPYRTEGDLFSSMYRTDHHWHTEAAYGCYTEQLEIMLPEATPVQVLQRMSFDDVPFIGSCSRSGLCEPKTPDHIDDCVIDDSGFTVIRDEKEYDADALSHREAYLAGDYNTDTYAHHYGQYFHSDWGLWQIENPNAQTDQSLLIVRDSFGGCMERFFAANYAHVYVVDFRNTDANVAQLLAEHEDIDDVLIVMGWSNLISEATITGLTP